MKVRALIAKVVILLSFVILTWYGVQLANYLGTQSILTELPTVTPTPFQPLSPTATPTATPVSYDGPPPQVVDGLQTYGQEQPLTGEELSALVRFLNTNPPALEEDTYYATFLASETAFQTFAQDEGESLQAYLVRHVAWMDRALKAANPPVEGGLVARRFIILTDGVFESDGDVRGIDYAAHGLLDSDGAWSFIDTYCHKSCSRYNLGITGMILLGVPLDLSTALLHEWAHSVFHLPDHYGLDYHLQYDHYGVLVGIPEEWQSYSAGGRLDISRGGFVMGGGGFTLRHYSALQLERRRTLRITHNLQAVGIELAGFVGEVPQDVSWDFGPSFAGAQVLVYQTEWADQGGFLLYGKVLSPNSVFDGYLDEFGRVDVGNLFAGYEITVPHAEGVLFIKVINGGETWFRWMDIRDFNLAYWHGFTNSVLMRMDLASAADDPYQFSWEIEYREIYPK